MVARILETLTLIAGIMVILSLPLAVLNDIGIVLNIMTIVSLVSFISVIVANNDIFTL